jgi:hypothetical protein
MKRSVSSLAIGLAGAVVLSGCAQGPKPPPAYTNFKCIDTSADATSFGRGIARSTARAALVHEIPDAKGFLLSSGVERVRVVSRRVDCQPFALSPAWTKCTAHARLCGR